MVDAAAAAAAAAEASDGRRNDPNSSPGSADAAAGAAAQPQEAPNSTDLSPFSSYSANGSGYKGDYVSDYELLLTGEKTSGSASASAPAPSSDSKPSVSRVVKGMRKTGGRPADTKLVPNLGSKNQHKQKASKDELKQSGAVNKKVAFQQQQQHTARVKTLASPAEAGRIFSSASAAAASASAAVSGESPTASAAAAAASHNTLFDHHAESILAVDSHFRRAAAAVWLVYPALVAVSYRCCPPDLVQPLAGVERNAAGLAAILLCVSVVSIVLPLLYRGRQRAFSGVVVGALTVQSVAFVTDLLMATVAVPVMIDPVFGTRVHLLRWCEWTPLAFLMTFLTEGVGVPDVLPNAEQKEKKSKNDNKGGWKANLGRKKKDDDYRAGGNDDDDDSFKSKSNDDKSQPDMSKSTHIFVAYSNGLAQGFSTLCGLAFPFCPGIKSWTFFMVVSCLLFLVIFYRLRCKIQSHRRMVVGSSVDEMEIYNRSLLSLKLLGTCTFLWTVLVCTYFFSAVGPTVFPTLEDRFDVSALTMVGECTMDVVAKVLYMFIIVDVHDQVFDQSARAERRLEELRQMMAVVWDNSSDVIGISVRSINGSVTTMLSEFRSFFYFVFACFGLLRRRIFLQLDGTHTIPFSNMRSCSPFLRNNNLLSLYLPPEGPTYLKIYQKRKQKLSAPRGGSKSSGKDTSSQGNALIFELDAKEFGSGDEGEEGGKDHASRRASYKDAQEASPTAFKEASSRLLSKGGAGRIVEPKIVYNIEFAASSSKRRNSVTSSGDDDDGGNSSSRRRAYGNVTGYAASETPDVRPEEFSSVAELVVRAWALDSTETLLMQDLVLLHEAEEHIIRCEAKVTRLEENALVIVVRDISERFRRFEAEKKVVHETTAREKDAEANRFTRHEVKNGKSASTIFVGVEESTSYLCFSSCHIH